MQTKEQTIQKGYKHTEVGVIPSDWEIVSLGSECDVVTKGTTPTSIGRDFKKNGVNFIKVESFDKKGNIIKDKVAFIDDQTHGLLKRSQLKSGDILFSIAGALGRVGIVNDDILPANTNQALAIVRLKSASNLQPAYVLHFLNTEQIKKHIESISVQGAQANISLQNINDLPIVSPRSEPEQTAIANALSDTDALIEKLTKLIKKKMNIKQGAMQELLTGKRRLPGFSGKWEMKKMEKVLTKITTGLNPRQNFQLGKGYNYYVTIKNFSNGKLFLDDRCDKISNEALFLINKRSNLEVGDILFASIGTEPSTYLINTAPRNWNINESVFSIKPDKKIINSSFLQLLLVADWNFEKLSKDATGSTFQSIKIKQLKNLELDFPKLDEQIAIATVLFDMDTEIERLESQLAKYQNLKQGMMQTLLTGKVRLI